MFWGKPPCGYKRLLSTSFHRSDQSKKNLLNIPHSVHYNLSSTNSIPWIDRVLVFSCEISQLLLEFSCWSIWQTTRRSHSSPHRKLKPISLSNRQLSWTSHESSWISTQISSDFSVRRIIFPSLRIFPSLKLDSDLIDNVTWSVPRD